MSNNKVKRKRFVLNGRNEWEKSPQHFCFDFDVSYNRHGNIEVEIGRELGFSFVPFFASQRYVFNRHGVCISHPPGKRYRHHKVNAELVESHT
jgi:hypothetical protein